MLPPPQAIPTLPGHSSALQRLWGWVLAPVLSLVMLGLTYAHWRSEERGSRDRRDVNFQVAAERIGYNLADRMATYEMVLRGTRGYFEGSERIDRQEFRSYVSSLQLQETRPGLKGISLILKLPAASLSSHIEDMRQRGFPQYTVRPPGDRPTYAAVTHIEPLDAENQRVLGLDAYMVPAAREALDRAADTGALAVSALLPLAQDEPAGGARGLVMYLPIYANGAALDTLQQRRAALLGWVSAPFHLAEVVAGLSREFDSDIGLDVLDGDAQDGSSYLYTDARLEHGQAQRQVIRPMVFGGHTWNLRMVPLPAFEDRYEYETHHLSALIGALLSLVLGWFAWLLATGRARAEALAYAMTAELRGARDELASTLNAIPDLLMEIGSDGRIAYCRSGHLAPLAEPARHFVGMQLEDIVQPDAAAGCRAAIQAATATGYSAGHQFRLDLQGQPYWFELSIARKPGGGPGEPPCFIALSRDITERKNAEARSHQLAYFDALTQLPNRRMLMDRMEQAVAAAQISKQMGAVLFVDLDNFKQINDARGHTVGDAMLKQVAQRLFSLLRPGDTVARLSGDEFVMLIGHLGADIEGAGRAALLVAETVRAALEVPYSIQTHLYSSTSSIGITLFPKQAEGTEDLLREADTAMYRAKDMGRNRIRFYEAAMQADVQERLALEQDLKKAAAEGQLAVYVQPQVNAQGAVVGGELLMRWNHPERGNVPPSRFIPLAEASGLILRMGDWMIGQACDALAKLQAQGQALSISVNVSERQFRQEDFVERIRNVLAATGAKPELLILEVTESLLIENLDDTIARMTELVQLGVRFSIDDFGTGYSSLAYLKRLPLYELKIDKSFVQDTPGDPNDTAIVQSILAVAGHLKLRVVAEGVETQAQADFLIQSHCECLQGYLFGRPQPLLAWLDKQMALGA
ncbi:EAL domain-containing protein [Acidovorax sp. 106]|uniref:bifunctional diguanylate cyclase/phosphodiesterase n=1 Tax=Acidovorax sp. 106 TaxID=2135637 RepID=UPI000EB590A0|nr:EAL domain-containing protein [Acidovorax sp. 106]RLJ40086.1 diguanylate cyclase (GGDEF)-like protein [Acidovorax sp. 106]